MWLKHRLLAVNVVLVLAVGGSFWGRRTESAAVPTGDFLAGLSLPFRGWKTTEFELSTAEKEMLQPDASILRRYESPKGEYAELAVVAGHRKRTVHTPGFCMVGDGWQVISQQTYSLPLEGRTIPVARVLMAKEGQFLWSTYFFTDGEASTNNLVKFQGTQLVKRLRSEPPLGAMVRILVPVTRGNPATAEKLTDEFCGAVLPPVLASLRKAREEMR